jgi:hypothetical protein
MNTIKRSAFAIAGFVFTLEQSFAAINPGTGLNQNLVGTTSSLPAAIQNIVGYLSGFLYLIAVLFAMYGGFLILTAGGKDENVKKGKTILTQGALGILVIFLASSIVNFVLGIFTGSNV